MKWTFTQIICSSSSNSSSNSSSRYSSSSSSSCCSIVVVAIKWCLSKTGSQISTAAGRRAQRLDHRSGQTPTSRSLSFTTTETLSSAAENGISVTQSHVSHLSKTIRPLPSVGWDPLAFTQESAKTSCAKKHPTEKTPGPWKKTPGKNTGGHAVSWKCLGTVI